MSAPLPLDPVLPQLAQALDPFHMGRVLAAPLQGVAVLACTLSRVKYRPGRNCSVAYRLRLRDLDSGREFEQGVGARFCGPGEALRRHHKALARPLLPSAAGPALQCDPGLEMLAHWWPNDARLPALRLLCDPVALQREALDEVVAALAGPSAVRLAHQVELVHVVPEVRACARVRLQLRPAPGAAASSHTLYVKTDAELGGARLHAAMLALRQGRARWAGQLRIAAPLCWQPATGLHWQHALPGQSLREVSVQDSQQHAEAIGQALAALHGTPVPGLSRLDVPVLLQQAQDAAALLRLAVPTAAAAADRLLHGLGQAAGVLSGMPAVSLHGDLHPGNVLLDQGQLGFIDLDQMRCGPAAWELGGWLSGQLALAARQALPLAPLWQAWQQTLAGHARGIGHTLPAAALAWGAAHHLLCRRAAGGVASLKPGRLAAVPQMLACAEAFLAHGRADATAWPSQVLA